MCTWNKELHRIIRRSSNPCRLAGVLAWWVPGSRDVVNGLGVEPPEEDNDDEVSDAVRLVLEKDPFVDATRIDVSTRDYVVTLEGLVPAVGEREMAEFDAWYVFGVDVERRVDANRHAQGGGKSTRSHADFDAETLQRHLSAHGQHLRAVGGLVLLEPSLVAIRVGLERCNP